MGEVAIKLSGDALQAVVTIRGSRVESLAETLSRALSIATLVETESARGAKVQFREADGTVRELASAS